jgi:hypothetical protein
MALFLSLSNELLDCVMRSLSLECLVLCAQVCQQLEAVVFSLLRREAWWHASFRGPDSFICVWELTMSSPQDCGTCTAHEVLVERGAPLLLVSARVRRFLRERPGLVLPASLALHSFSPWTRRDFGTCPEVCESPAHLFRLETELSWLFWRPTGSPCVQCLSFCQRRWSSHLRVLGRALPCGCCPECSTSGYDVSLDALGILVCLCESGFCRDTGCAKTVWLRCWALWPRYGDDACPVLLEGGELQW